MRRGAQRRLRRPLLALAPLFMACAMLLVTPTACQTSCSPGSYPVGPACQPCPAGSACAGGVTAPVACGVDWYQPATGQSACLPCPAESYAHFPGSTGCLACYFGEPKVYAGTIDGQQGMWPNRVPEEQPSPGYRVATLTAGLPSCGASPFSACTSTAGATLAIATDATCLVRLYVLGDSACSYQEKLLWVTGAYASTQTIKSRGGDMAAGASFQLAPAAGSTNGSLAMTFEDGSSSCGGSLLVHNASAAAPAGACPKGTYLDTNAQVGGDSPASSVFKTSQCVPCAAGTYCPAGTQQPPACPPGTYNAIVGGTVCSSCGPGTISTGGADTCVQCDPGTTPSADKASCNLCGPGQYSLLPGVPCQPCPAGTYRGAEGDGIACVKCNPGTYSGPGAAECTPCAPGTAAEDEGSTPDADTGSCPRCPAGSFADGYGSYTCNPCPQGSFTASAGSTSCTPCGPGEITFKFSLSDGGATGCWKCPKGYYKPPGAGDNKCRSCPAGYETGVDGTGASSCTPCDKGYYAPKPSSPLCLPCEPGTFANTTGSRACRQCSAGYVTGLTPTNAKTGSRTGSTAVAAYQCDPCPLRTFRPSITSGNMCTPCPRGRETKRATAATLCTPCIPGTVLVRVAAGIYNASCTPCKPGEVTWRHGAADNCSQCRPGSYAADFGNSACDLCEPGTFQDNPGASGCKACPEGSYNPEYGSISAAACKKAPKGSYAQGPGNDGFVPCDPGSYQDEEGKASCKPCPPGNECPASSTAPTLCRPGFAADWGQPVCRECSPGTFQDQPGQRSCKPCLAGGYCPSSGMAAVLGCPPGTFGTKTGRITQDESCLPCPQNTYNAGTRQTRCTKCGSGTWTGSFSGMTECWSILSLLPFRKSATVRSAAGG